MNVHSFGGSGLDRHIFDFEAIPGEDPGLALEAPAGGESGGGEAAPWAPSQDDWTQMSDGFEQMRQTVEMLAGLEAQRAAPYMQPQTRGNEVPMPDPWNRPDSYEQDLEAYIDSKIQPFAQRFETLDQQDGQERLTDVLSDLEQEKGEFLAETRDDMYALAKAHARDLYPQFAARMGNGDPAAEAALAAAFDYAKTVEQKLVQAAVARHTNEIATLAGAPRPAGTEYGEGMRVRTVPNWLEDKRTIAEKLLAEQAG